MFFCNLESAFQECVNQNRFRRTYASCENGSDRINLRDNDYLGLMRNPRVEHASCEAVVRYGSSSSGSPVVGGYLDIHEKLEALLCDWVGYPSGLLWPSGYAANRALLQLLLQKGDCVFADRLIHRSMLEGALSTSAQLIRYGHRDLDHLEALLKKQSPSRRIFVLTESVFSMDGDLEDLSAMAALKEKYPFFWVVDEAHAIGWYGPLGAGCVRGAGLESVVDVIVGTLGKSLASQGAFTLFRNSRLRDYCINLAPEFMYSTYLAPALVGAALGAIEYIREELYLEQPVWKSMAYRLKQQLHHDFPSIEINDAPIIPIIIGEERDMLHTHECLYHSGLLTGAIRPPSVPVGSSRIRLSLKRGLDPEVLLMRIFSALQWREQSCPRV